MQCSKDILVRRSYILHEKCGLFQLCIVIWSEEILKLFTIKDTIFSFSEKSSLFANHIILRLNIYRSCSHVSRASRSVMFTVIGTFLMCCSAAGRGASAQILS